MKVLGGHDGLRVYRTDKGILKSLNHDTEKAVEWHDMNMKGIHNEARFLQLLEGCGYTPKLLEEGDDYILQEDVGDRNVPTSIQDLMRHCCRMLNLFREKRVRHIDLTWVNVIARDNHPWAVDWQQSRMYDEAANPQERNETDTAVVWRWMIEIKDNRGVKDEARIIRRWYNALGALGALRSRLSPLEGKSFLDLGCFQGDHVAMARCEGMEAEGVDYGGFRTGEDSIEIAESLWKGMGCKFTKEDIFDVANFRRDVVTMFSTWPYLVQKDKEKAIAVLRRIVVESGAFFFETQLYGDGPGPEFLKTDSDVEKLLRDCGAKQVKPLITIPVYGRPTSRTVWEAK